MARYVTTLTTPRSVDEVFSYLADLRNFAEWDPGVRRVVQLKGAGGGPFAEFDVTVAGVGKAPDLTLRYRTVEYAAPRELLVIAQNAVLTSEDRITVVPAGDGATVTYDADLRLRGPLRLLDPVLGLTFRHIGDRAAAGMRAALGGVQVPA